MVCWCYKCVRNVMLDEWTEMMMRKMTAESKSEWLCWCLAIFMIIVSRIPMHFWCNWIGYKPPGESVNQTNKCTILICRFFLVFFTHEKKDVQISKLRSAKPSIWNWIHTYAIFAIKRNEVQCQTMSFIDTCRRIFNGNVGNECNDATNH